MATYQFHDVVKTVTRLDRRHGKRQVPMKVLALGLCRTGTDCEFYFILFFLHGLAELKLTNTAALRQALRALGYNDTYHGYMAALENPRDCELWYEALRAKYDGVGKQFGREDFDQLLGNCQVRSAFQRDFGKKYLIWTRLFVTFRLLLSRKSS